MKKTTCAKCGGQNLNAKTIDFPLKVGQKTMVINRVAAKLCADCGAAYPTKAGEEKIARLVGSAAHLGFFR